MSRASKIASARGQAHTARHATNVARAKLRRVTDERDQLRARIESLSPFPTEALASLEQQNAELRAQVAALTEYRDEFRSLWEAECDMHGKTFAAHKAQISKLTAALKKAREALEKIGDMAYGWGSPQFVALEALAAIDGVLNCNEISTPLTGEKGESK